MKILLMRRDVFLIFIHHHQNIARIQSFFVIAQQLRLRFVVYISLARILLFLLYLCEHVWCRKKHSEPENCELLAELIQQGGKSFYENEHMSNDIVLIPSFPPSQSQFISQILFFFSRHHPRNINSLFRNYYYYYYLNIKMMFLNTFALHSKASMCLFGVVNISSS